MEKEVDILKSLYFESWASIRHLEEQRAQFTSVAVAGMAVMVACFGLGFDELGARDRLRATAFGFWALCALGVFGTLVLAKTFERIKFLLESMDAVAERLDAVLTSLRLGELTTEILARHAQKHKILASIRYASVWAWAFRIAFIVGLIGGIFCTAAIMDVRIESLPNFEWFK